MGYEAPKSRFFISKLFAPFIGQTSPFAPGGEAGIGG